MKRPTANVLVVDTADPKPPSGLPSPSGDAGEVVILAADDDAHAAGWPGRAAIAIAQEWSARGMRVILADGDLGGAGLHALVGARNGEGVSDMVLYGASPTRVSQRLESRAFLFVSAGTVVSDPTGLLGHGRWPALLGAFRESGCVLLLYLSSGGDEVRTLLSEGDRVYRLSARCPESDPEPGIVVLVGEGDGTSTGAAVPRARAEPQPDEARARDEGGTGQPSDAAEAVGEVDVASPSGAESTSTSTSAAGAEAAPSVREAARPPDKGKRTGNARRAVALGVVLLVIVGGLFLAAWLGYFTIPGLMSLTGIWP
jgi:hypothetical protein